MPHATDPEAGLSTPPPTYSANRLVRVHAHDPSAPITTTTIPFPAPKSTTSSTLAKALITLLLLTHLSILIISIAYKYDPTPQANTFAAAAYGFAIVVWGGMATLSMFITAFGTIINAMDTGEDEVGDSRRCLVIVGCVSFVYFIASTVFFFRFLGEILGRMPW